MNYYIYFYYPLWWRLRSQTKIFLDKYRIKTLNWNGRTPKVHIQVRGIYFTKPRHKFGWKFTSKHFQQHYLPPSPISAYPSIPLLDSQVWLFPSLLSVWIHKPPSIHLLLLNTHNSLSISYHSLPPPKDQSYWWFPTLIFLMVFFSSTHSPTGMLLLSLRDNTYTGCNFGVFTRSSCFRGWQGQRFISLNLAPCLLVGLWLLNCSK